MSGVNGLQNQHPAISAESGDEQLPGLPLFNRIKEYTGAIGEAFMNGRERALAYGASTVMAIGGAGYSLAQETQPANATVPTPKPHSLSWLQKHCSIVVPANVFAPGGSNAKKSGVTLHGKVMNANTAANPTPYPEVEYSWHLTKAVQFCGFVAAFPQAGSPARFISETPTSQTKYGGEFKTSLQGSSGLHIEEVFVYARHK